MRQKQVKKLRRIYNSQLSKQAREQGQYIRMTLKPCPKHWLVFKIWIFFARFYFTKDHIDMVQSSYERITYERITKR